MGEVAPRHASEDGTKPRPSLDRASLQTATPASLQDHLRPEHPGVVEAYILSRLPFVLSLGFQQVTQHDVRRDTLAEFVGRLGAFPVWVLAEAFDCWGDQHKRAPTPADLLILCNAAVEPIRAEMKHREYMRMLHEEHQAEEQRRKHRGDPDRMRRYIEEVKADLRAAEKRQIEGKHGQHKPNPVQGTSWRANDPLVRASHEAARRSQQERRHCPESDPSAGVGADNEDAREAPQ